MGLVRLTESDVSETMPRVVSRAEASNALSHYSEARQNRGLDRLLNDLDGTPEAAHGASSGSDDDAGDVLEAQNRQPRFEEW